MRSCGSILIAGAVILGIGVMATGGEQPSWFISALVFMAVIGFIIQSASKNKKNKERSKAAGKSPALSQGKQGGSGRSPQGLPGWSLVSKSESLAEEWHRKHHVLPTTTAFNLRTGRSHRRHVFVFQATPATPAKVYVAFRIKDYTGPEFTAVSSGGREISVSSSTPAGLKGLLQDIGPQNFQRLGVSTGRLFWAELDIMTNEQVDTFILRQLPTMVQQVNEHLITDEEPAQQRNQQARAQEAPRATRTSSTRTTSTRATASATASARLPAPTGRPVAGPPPTQRPAAQATASQRPPARLNPVAARSTKLAHDLGPDPDEILQTGPIEVNERPALQPAKADPVAESLENPELATEWKPAEWSPTPFQLNAPMGLGETPSATDALGGGWKPKEWKPSEYGSSTIGEWKPAESWQPNYSTTSDDQESGQG